MSLILSVFAGGGIGSLLRYLVSSRIGNHWGIMLVNVFGAFCIGIAYELCVKKLNVSPEARAFVMTGMLGGFTTFSTYMLDFGMLVDAKKMTEALVYLSGSVAAGIFFLYAGMLLGRGAG